MITPWFGSVEIDPHNHLVKITSRKKYLPLNSSRLLRTTHLFFSLIFLTSRTRSSKSKPIYLLSAARMPNFFLSSFPFPKEQTHTKPKTQKSNSRERKEVHKIPHIYISPPTYDFLRGKYPNLISVQYPKPAPQGARASTASE